MVQGAVQCSITMSATSVVGTLGRMADSLEQTRLIPKT